MQFGLNARTTRFALSVSMLAALAACGGGDGDADTGSPAAGGTATITLSGQVVDGPIAGAKVCLFSGGAQARNAAGEAICASETDAQGNYTMTVPRNLAPGFITLVATKGSDIKLASTVGTVDQLLAIAGTGGAVTTAGLPTAKVTHFTTADFALADTNNDGTVSKDEQDAYVPDSTVVQKAATLIKAVIDFSQGSALIGGQTPNTLALAAAAVRNQPLGSGGQTPEQWFADPANAEVIAAVNKDLADTLDGKFAKYQLSKVVTASFIPPVVSRNGGAATIYCGIETQNTTEVVEIALDAARRAAVLRYTDEGETGQMVGSYDPASGAVSIDDIYPREVAQTSPDVVFYTEGYFKVKGTVDAAGNFAGTFADMSATTWTLDATRQECTASGTVTATRQ